MKKLKKLTAGILILTLLLVGCDSSLPKPNGQSGGTNQVAAMVAEPMDSLEIQYEGAVLPDLYCFAGGVLETEVRNTWDTYYCQGYRSREASPALPEAYVELLCREYDFERIGDPLRWTSKDGDRQYVEYALRYTGSAHVSDTPIISSHGNIPCDVSVFINSLDDSQLKRCCVDYARWLTVLDTGYRYGTEEVYDTYVGTSFGAGLNRMKDGSYQTTDGRFSVALGEAMFLMDGETVRHSAWMELSEKDEQKRICVESVSGVRQMGFHLPLETPVISGDLFTVTQMCTQNSDHYSTMPDHDTMFAVLHGEQYLLPDTGLFGTMSCFNARMMYWDTEASAAVFYFCVQFRAEPYEIEGLVAVSLRSDSEQGNPEDADYIISKGESVEIKGPSEFGAGYNLWTWEYISGSELSELQHATSQTCTLVGHKEGIVHIRVTYEYSVKEPDVLTGNETYAQKKKTEEYVIHIRG